MTAAADLGVRLSPLDAEHRGLGATFTDFAGWRLPLRFSSDLAEHRAVRSSSGLFDISHMGQLFVSGADADAQLARAVVSDVRRLDSGVARYTMICSPSGGVLDDVIVYRLNADDFLVIANAANTAAVLEELRARTKGSGVTIEDRTAQRALLSIQGPAAARLLAGSLADGAALPRRFRITELEVAGVAALVARTGYTGEDGFEISVEAQQAPTVWGHLLDIGSKEIMPIGLAARDSLRLEAALPLYGHELTASRSPFEAGYGMVVDLDHDFVGDQSLRKTAINEPSEVLVGMRTLDQRAPRAGYLVLDGDGHEVGAVTSGGPSPTLGAPIALAYVARSSSAVGTELVVDVRGRAEAARVVPLPFYRRAS